MPDMKKLYDLAYQFRNETIWTKVYEEEVFAVALPDGKTAYCNIMGRNGEHRAVSVHIGAEAFATSFWPLLDGDIHSYADMLVQDCIQCSIEKTGQFDPEELDMVRNYCKSTNTPFRTPYPQFSRYRPRCIPWRVEDEADWTAVQTVLEVIHLMNETIRWKGKDSLLLNAVINIPVEETDQVDMFGQPKTDHLAPELIPFYTIKDGELHITPTKLPLRMERTYKGPDRFDAKKIKKLITKKQSGVLECEVVQMPEPVEGTPPYIPSVLLMAQETDGMLLSPVMMRGAAYDPNEVVANLVNVLLASNVYPKRIKIRTRETKAIMKPFCQKAMIWVEETENLPNIDEAKESMVTAMGDEDLDNNIDEIVDMLDNMTNEQIGSMPDDMVELIKNIMPILPADIVAKLKRVWK